MSSLEHQYGRAFKPEELAEFLAIDVSSLLSNIDRWGGLEVAPGIIRFFQKKIDKVFNAQPTKNDDSTPTICFYSEGDYWRIGEMGKAQAFKKVKGLGFIHFLLLHPNEHLEADVVYNCGLVPVGLDNDRRNGLHSVKEITEDGLQIMEDVYESEIDNKTRRAYEIRIEDLEKQLVGGNPEEILEIRDEIKQLKDILSRKDRKIRTESTETVRLNVTKRTKEALQKIYANEGVSSLKRYLNEATIKRGGSCIYQPDPNDTPRWILHKNELPSQHQFGQKEFDCEQDIYH